MQLVMRFAKPGRDGEELVREKVVTVKTFSTQHWNWHEAVATAIFHTQPGERIVAIFEEGHAQ